MNGFEAALMPLRLTGNQCNLFDASQRLPIMLRPPKTTTHSLFAYMRSYPHAA